MFTEELVKQYENIGFRPIGLYANHIPAIKWAADNDVYNDPTFRWSTSDKVTVDRKLGTPNIATMLGRTSLKDSETGEYLNLNVLDTDSVTVSNRLRVPIRTILDNSSYDWVTDRLRDRLEAFLNEEGVVNGNLEETLLDILKKSSYVTKTRKGYGYHFYWLSLKQNPPIGTADCLPEKEFELKTNDKYGLCTLPDSTHRDDPKFRYKAIGCTDTNLVSNVLYDLFVEMFKDCLVNGKLDDSNRNNRSSSGSNDNSSTSNNSSNLSDRIRNMTTLLIIDNSVVIEKPHRHHTLLSIANSLLFKHSETKSNAELKKFFIQINKQCCKPEPQPDSDIERIWSDVTAYVSTSKRKVSPEDINFVIKTMKKEAPHDETSIKQLFYGMNSAFTKLPIHHNVNSRKSGSGKTYDLTLTAGYFPDKYVLALAGVSDKGFIHEEGIQVLVDEDTGVTTPIGPSVKDLELEIENVKEKIDDLGMSKKPEVKSAKKELRKQIKDYESQIEELYSKSQKLIILDNRIILVLDTAQEGLFNALMSIISQDTPKDQVYQFTDKNGGGSGKLGATKNRFRGTPCMFTTQVIDDTRQTRYQEKNRRFIHVTPNISHEKIHSATNLIGQRFGLLPDEYDGYVVSKEDREHSKEIVGTIVSKLIEHSARLNVKESGIKIPFYESIVHCLNSGAGEGANEWAMTVMDRMMRYLTIITKVNMDSRPKIIDTERGVFYVIATFDDLKETLQLMGIASSAVRPYIANWYNKAFLPKFNKLDGKPHVDKVDDRIIASEIEVGLTTKDLAEATKEYMHVPKPSREDVLRDYIYPLLNQGIIDKSKSVINAKEIILSPAEEGKIFSLFADEGDENNGNGPHRLKVNDIRFYPNRSLIEESFRTLSKCSSKQAGKNDVPSSKYLLVDPDGNEISVQELISKYLNNPETCFRRNSMTEAEARLMLLTEGVTPVRGYEERYYSHYFLPPVWSNIFTEFYKNGIEESSSKSRLIKISWNGEVYYRCVYCGLKGPKKSMERHGTDCIAAETIPS